MFGDILSDEVFMFIGLFGMFLLVSLLSFGFYLFEFVYGFVFDIVGKGMVNLFVVILLVVMFLRIFFGFEEEVKVVEDVVNKVLVFGKRIRDLVWSEEFSSI